MEQICSCSSIFPYVERDYDLSLQAVAFHIKPFAQTTVQTFPISIHQEDLTLQYHQAQIKVIETKAQKKSKNTTNDIWTLSPYPRPIAVEQPKSFTNSIDIQTVSSPQLDTVRTLVIAKPQTEQKDVYGQTASISGPNRAPFF